jgi:hypothetical protein
MVARDRIKVAEEAALHAAPTQSHPSSQHDALRQARFAETQTQDRKQDEPNLYPSKDQNRKSWRDFLQKDKSPRRPIQSYRSETGRSIMDEHKKAKAKKWEPKPSSTWIKSHYGERGWSGLKKAEREKERRAGVLGGQQGLVEGGERRQRMGEWYT